MGLITDHMLGVKERKGQRWLSGFCPEQQHGYGTNCNQKRETRARENIKRKIVVFGFSYVELKLTMWWSSADIQQKL